MLQWLEKMRYRHKVKTKIRNWLLTNPDALHYILETFGTFHLSYNSGARDPEKETFFNEGRRSAGKDFLDLCHLTPGQLDDLRSQEVRKNYEDSEQEMNDD